MFYSKSTGGFYSKEINGDNMPKDTVEITDNQYAELMTAQSNGKIISSNESGYPIAIDPHEYLQIPSIVTMRQARLALLEAGLLDTVDESIALIPDNMQRKQAEIDWEFATSVHRSSHLVNGLAGALSLTEEMLDDLFLKASKL